MDTAAGRPASGRRRLIKQGLLLLAGGIGMSAAARQSGVQAAAVATPAQPNSLTLHGRGWHVYSADQRSGMTPRRGEQLAAAGELLDGAGNRIGDFHASLICTGSPFSPGSPPLTYMEQHTFVLEDGALFGMGVSGSSADAFAIVGGTGRYLGASGSYVARQSHAGAGGDGSADFTLTLI